MSNFYIVSEDSLIGVANEIRDKAKVSGPLLFPNEYISTIHSIITTGTDTSDATAVASDIILGKTAYARGEKLTGTYIVPSGSITIDKNDTTDVTNIATVVTDVPPGIGEDSETSTSDSSSVSFKNVLFEPIAFVVMCSSNISISKSNNDITSVIYDGAGYHGTSAMVVSGNSGRIEYSENFSHTYSNNTLTVTSNSRTWYFSGDSYYRLVYIYKI